MTAFAIGIRWQGKLDTELLGETINFFSLDGANSVHLFDSSKLGV
jgi:hypothetical protein